MKAAQVVTIVFLVVYSGVPVHARRDLQRSEVLEIVEQLTSAGRQTWIPAGTIEAEHRQYKAPRTTDASLVADRIAEEIREYQSAPDKLERTAELQKSRLDAIPFNVRYELSNESSTTSSVLLRHDGTRFYWEIVISSRSDSITPPANLAGNCMVNYFNRSWNDHRIFAWDGQKYTIYAVSAQGAIVDASERLPRAVTGPLTAGVVPWGTGLLTHANLAAASISATETTRDGTTLVEMTIEPSDSPPMTFVLDPSKDLAVDTCTVPGGNGAWTSIHYAGYRNIEGHWVPTTILIEQYEAFSNRLLQSDKWDFTAVDARVPGPTAFDVGFAADTVVEYYSPATAKALAYHHSNAIDMDLLLAERLAYAAGRGRGPQNCAAASLRYAATQLGRAVPVAGLRQMVGSDGRTTMYDLKRSAQSLGFHCRVVRTDLTALETLSGCQAILHIPGHEHFVVLDRVDDRYAWIVDLANNRFYTRKDRAFMAMDWPEGTALLLSNQPIAGPFTDMPESALRYITGGDGWSCTRALQEEYIIPCVPYPNDGGCFGYFQWYFDRWGCEPAPSGTCVTDLYARMAGTDCYTTLLMDCRVTGIWDWYAMSACD